jgi:hypothetical protein
MRIEALDVNASSGILAAALISGKNPAWDEDEDGSAMGVTGRTFPAPKPPPKPAAADRLASQNLAH